MSETMTIFIYITATLWVLSGLVTYILYAANIANKQAFMSYVVEGFLACIAGPIAPIMRALKS